MPKNWAECGSAKVALRSGATCKPASFAETTRASTPKTRAASSSFVRPALARQPGELCFAGKPQLSTCEKADITTNDNSLQKLIRSQSTEGQNIVLP